MNALLRAADPAAGVEPDAGSPAARQLLADVLATRRHSSRVHPFPVRRLVVGGALTAAAVVASVVAISPPDDTPVGPAGFTVSRDGHGTVRAVVRWSALSDPAALQAALDRAGARTRVFVETDSATMTCQANDTTVPYSAHAVQWHSPTDANTDNGIVVHPGEFPTDGTFVLVVELARAGSAHGSTFASGFPQITGTLSYMTIGEVSAPSCG